MKLTFKPGKFTAKRCLIMVGGTGDTDARFSNIVDITLQGLPDYEICTFTLTETDIPSLTHNQQVNEVYEIVDELVHKYHFKFVDVFCTSMGAYATSFLLSNPKYSDCLGRVIFFDPADYYIDETLANAQGDSWTGVSKYQPVGRVASDNLRDIQSSLLVHVVKLTVRNYGKNGYYYADYKKRGDDLESQYPRISSQMVRSFYEKVPSVNQGKYLEINHLPHGFLRDGNISENEGRVAQIIINLLITGESYS